MTQEQTENPAASSITTIVGTRGSLIAYISSAPALITIAAILAFPVLFAAYQSFFDAGPLKEDEPFVGFDNYTALFADPQFWSSMLRTGIFVGGVVVMGITLALVFGFALNRIVAGLKFIRGLAILPYVVSSVAAAMMFRTLFNSDFGFPNRFLELIGLDGLPWFADPTLAMIVVIVAQVWTDLPLALLFVVGGLQTIDRALLDAAKVDGATNWRSAFHISIPLIAPQVVLATVWLSYKAVTSLGTVLALTGGGPRDATQLLTLEMVRLGFNEFDVGTASAVVIVIFVLNMVLTLGYLGLQRKFGVEER